MNGFILRQMDTLSDEEIEGLCSLLSLYKDSAKNICLSCLRYEQASLEMVGAL